MTQFLPGVYASPYFLFRNTEVDVIRYGNMELYREDKDKAYYDLFVQMRLNEVVIEGSNNVAYMEVC